MIKARKAHSAVLRTVLLLFMTALAASLLVSCGVNPGFGDTGGGTTTPPRTGHLVVTDSGNHRILIYDAPFSTDESASVVLGQPNFTQGSPNQGYSNPVGANTMRPTGAALDAAGNLWVADGGNCRVVEFGAPFSTDMDASLVIGLRQLTTQPPNSCQLSETPTSSGMDYPVAVAFDRRGDLWVADSFADRITEYRAPLTGGMAAAIAIGQTGLENTSQCNGGPRSNTNSTLPPMATTLCFPGGIAFDSAGDLWVADSENGRVLEYRPPFSTGMAASLELGLPAASAFTSRGCAGGPGGTTAKSLCFPAGVAFDASGDLWVADWGNGRVLKFIPPFANGMAATLVIGKPNFTENIYSNGMSAPTASDLLRPNSLSFDSDGDLIVGDYIENRVLMYVPPFSSGMAATVVLGQPNMTSGTTNQCSGEGCEYPMPTAKSLSLPSVGGAY